MSIPLTVALHELYPNVCWSMVGQDFNSLVWPEGEGDAPPADQVRAYADGRDTPICSEADHARSDGMCPVYAGWVRRTHPTVGFGIGGFGCTGDIK